MNATELQTRIRNIAYRLVVLCDSLPPEKNFPGIDRQPTQHYFSSEDCRPTAHAGGTFGTKINTTFIELAKTLCLIGSMVDIHVIQAAKLSSIVSEADELTRVLASPGIFVAKKSELK